MKNFQFSIFNFQKKEGGFTLLLAIVVTATLLLVSTGIVTVAVREALLAASGRESQYAFYAADSGVECAIYWDVKNPTGSGASAFSSTSAQLISCNNQSFTVGGSAVSSFTENFPPAPFCATVTVTKSYSADTLVTKIESLGYNTCDTANPRRVQRAVRVSY